jgi:hypothetical protein
MTVDVKFSMTGDLHARVTPHDGPKLGLAKLFTQYSASARREPASTPAKQAWNAR